MLVQVNEALADLERAAWGLRAFSREVSDWSHRSARLSSTGWMLTALVADYRAFAIYSAFLGQRKTDELRRRLHLRNARRFYQTSVAQGGAFVKVGQLLSARPDLLPEIWVNQLAGLQDDVPTEPFEAVQAVIEAELGG